MNKKIIIGIILIILVVLGVSQYNSSQNSDDLSPVSMGLVLPLTGNAGFLGEAAQKAAQMALEDYGNTKYEYNLVFEDDGFDPKKTVTAVNKLISLNKVSSLITFGSGTSNAAAPITEEAQIPRFGLASDPTSLEGDYNYIHWTPPFMEGELISSEIVKRGYKKVSIVDANHPGPMAVSEAVADSLEKEGVNVVSYDLTNIGEKDFRTVINNIKSKNPDIIVVTLFSPEVEILTKQMRELGLNTPVTSAETFEWSDQPELFEGMWFVSDARVSDEFNQKFEDRFGITPKPGSAYIYDLVYLLIDTQESSDHKLSPQELQEEISKINSYNSTVFGEVPINDQGLFITGASVKKIENGKVVFE